MSQDRAEYSAGNAQPPSWTPSRATVSDLEPREDNPKTISKSHARRLLAKWKTLGQFQTLAIGPRQPNGRYPIYDGHQRYFVLCAAGMQDTQVACLQSDRALSDDEWRELVITAHYGTVGQIDWDKISGWDASKLTDWGMDADLLRDWGKDLAGLGELIRSQDETPDFQPVGIDEQGRLDQKSPIVCPHCGESFVPK